MTARREALERDRDILATAIEACESNRDLAGLIETHDLLDRQVKRLYRPEGRERIELLGSGEVRFKARTRSGGRGLTGDKTILDEAFALRASHLGALLPIMLTKPHGQVIYASSAGLPESAVLRGLRDRGRRGDARLAYFEWGDTRPNEGCALVDCDHAVTRDGCALDDRERWWQILPALGTRVTEESVADLRRSMPPDEFAGRRPTLRSGAASTSSRSPPSAAHFPRPSSPVSASAGGTTRRPPAECSTSRSGRRGRIRRRRRASGSRWRCTSPRTGSGRRSPRRRCGLTGGCTWSSSRMNRGPRGCSATCVHGWRSAGSRPS